MFPGSRKRRWSAGLTGRLTAQHQRRKAALASIGVTKITLTKGGVTESRRMDLSAQGAMRVHSMAYWSLWLRDNTGLTLGETHRLLTLLEERLIFPACFVISKRLFWSESVREQLVKLAKAYERHNADDDAFAQSNYVRTFRRKLRQSTLEKNNHVR